MTVGELKKKLELYRNDTEIFVWHYEDMLCQDSYNDFTIVQEDVRMNVSKKGYEYYTKWNAQIGAKQHTVLVIG